MEFKKRGILALVVGLLILGASIELIKDAKSSPQRAAINNQAFDIGHMELRNFHQKAETSNQMKGSQSKVDEFRKRLSNSGKKVMGLGALTNDPSHSFKKVKNKKKKDKKKSDKKKDKKAKKDKKKKKKKKKDLKVAESDDNYKDITEEPENEENNDSNTASEELIVTGAFAPNTQKNNSPSDIPLSAEEWLDYILNSPNFVKTTKLINYYQTRLVSSEVFYIVVDAMLEDRRDELHDFAVVALASTPSYKSFIMLTDIKGSSAILPETKAKAENRLRGYQAPSRLSFLKQVLTSSNGDPNHVQSALRELKYSTERYLVEREPSEAGTSNSLNALQLNSYRTLEKILEEVIQRYANDSTIVSMAQESLEKVKTIPAPVQ